MSNYQTLTLKELKDLLRDRNIAGRSKATTKEKAIALLEECDRLSAENEPEETPVEETPVEETLISREVRHYISSAGEGWLDENDEWTEDAAKACPYTVSELSAKLAELRRSGKKGLQTSFDIVENFTGAPPSPPAPPIEPEPEPEPDPKAECFRATLEKAAKLKSLMAQTLAPAENSTEAPCFNANLESESNQKINRRERIETSSIQSPSGASVNQDCFQEKETRCSSINAEPPQIIPQSSDDNENNLDFAERLAEQIWRSPLEFIDRNGQAAKRVSLLQAKILAGLSPDSTYRLITFDDYINIGQVITMLSLASSPAPAPASPPAPAPARQAPAPARQASAPARQASAPARQASAPASEFFLSFVSGGGKRYWLGAEDEPTPNPSRAETYSERHAKAKAAYHRQFPQEFPGIQIFERSQNQWYEHRLVQAGKSWRERSTYEVVPVNPIDLSPRSPPCTA